MISSLFIIWNPDLIICHLGPLAIRWYSTCWLIGLLLGYFIVKHLYRELKIADEKFEPLFLYCFIGILAGARLGHCLFYEPEYFLSSGTHIIEMLLPVRMGIDGEWHFTGYEGLASHGGSIGVILALILYSKVMKISFWTAIDCIAIAAPTTATFIRLGNLMNSEIIGKATDLPWAFIFERVDIIPRHPAQLYEAIAYFIIFFIVWAIWRKRPELCGTGFFLGIVLTLIFTFRFFIEYSKEIQVAFEAGLPIDMGQILSIPLVILGIWCMWRGHKAVNKE